MERAEKVGTTLEEESFEKKHDGNEFKKVSFKKKKEYKTREYKHSVFRHVDQPDVKRAKYSYQDNAGSVSSNVYKRLTPNFDNFANGISTVFLGVQSAQDLEEQQILNSKLGHLVTLRLREIGTRASLQTPQENRTPVFLTDIQHLLMSAVVGRKSAWSPDRWCYLENANHLSHSVVVVVEGISLFHYLSNERQFSEINKIFNTRLELVLPPCKKGMVIEEIAKLPITAVQAQQLIDEHGCLESAIEMIKDPTLLVSSLFPIDTETMNAEKIGLPPNDKFPRTKLLLSALQMVDDGYPMPLRGELSKRFKSYVFTKSKYARVSDHSPMYAVDCEMCKTSIGSNELTRVSIVNEALETVYETLVLPSNRIIDYLTPYSGITPEIMKTVTKSLADVQNEVQNLLPQDAILVGHSLNFDLNAMKMMHPYVIDTSICFNLSGFRKRKAKLQTLAKTFLKESIQENKDGHDSVEDSLASIKLVKMKLTHNFEFGDQILLQNKRRQEIINTAKIEYIKNNFFACVSQRDKTTAIVTTTSFQDQVKEILKKAESASGYTNTKPIKIYELNNNKDAVNKCRKIAMSNSLTIGNLLIEEKDVQFENISNTISKLEKWIGKLWKSVEHNGMFIVLFGGTTDCPSGLAKIAIKNNTGEIIVDNNVLDCECKSE